MVTDDRKHPNKNFTNFRQSLNKSDPDVRQFIRKWKNVIEKRIPYTNFVGRFNKNLI